MRKLISLIISVLALVAVIYLVTMVPMGSKTLWQHLKSIAETKESKEMVEGVKKTAQGVIKKTTAPDDGSKKSKDKLTPEDRKKLRKLLQKLDGEEEKGAKGAKKSAKETKAEEAKP